MSDEKVTKRMGQLLRRGAALLHQACPKCNTPLLRLTDGTMYCAKCDKTVVENTSVKPRKATAGDPGDILNQLATKILVSLQVLYQSLPDQPHPEEIRTFAATVRDLIEALRAIRDLQS